MATITDKDLELLHEFFPYTDDISKTVEFCRSLGTSDRVIKDLLLNGQVYSFQLRITNPADGSEHRINKVWLKIEKIGSSTHVRLDGKRPEEFFAALEENEKKYKDVLAVSGSVDDLYRENLQLKEEIEMLKEERDEWKKLAERAIGEGK